MIPVNLAVIGIGGRSDRVRGFTLGVGYGAGITITTAAAIFRTRQPGM